MNEEQILKFVEDMQEFYGHIPHPVHEPIRFAHYIKVYRYHLSLQTVRE